MTDYMSMHPTVVGQEICVIPNGRNFRLNTEAKLPTKLREKGVTKEVWNAALGELEVLSKADPFHIKLLGMCILVSMVVSIVVPVISVSTLSSSSDPSGGSTIVVAVVPAAVMMPLAIINIWLQLKHQRWFFERVRDLNTKYFVKYGVSCHWIRAAGGKSHARRVMPGLTFHECDTADDSSDDEATEKKPGNASAKSAGNKDDDSDGSDNSDGSDDDDDDKVKVTPHYEEQRHPNHVAE